MSARPLTAPTDIDKRDLPGGWTWARLKDLGEFLSGGTPATETEHYWGGTVPFVTGADVTRKYVRAGRNYLTEAGLRSGRTAVCNKGTVLVVTRTRVGHIGIAAEMMGASQDLSPYICGSRLLPEYLYYFWLSQRPALQRGTRGSTIQGLTRHFVEDIWVPLPPREEQKRIAAILDEQLAAVEQAKAALQDQIKTASQLPNACLREAFDGVEAARWPRRRLRDILKLRNEVVHPRDKPSGPATFVGLEHIESGTGARAGQLPVEMSELTGRKPRFHKGNLVYGYLRPYLNKVWVAEFDGLCSVDQYVYKVVTSEADTEFVAWFMRSPVYLKRAPIDLTPGQLPRIRKEEVASVSIGLPPLGMQRRIASRMSQQFAKTASLQRALQTQLHSLDRLAGALLDRAFRGEL